MEQAFAQIYDSWVAEGVGVSFKGQGLKLDKEEDAKEVVEKISQCKDLTFLELEGNTLGIEAGQAIGKALESKSELKAALWKDLFTGRLKNEIPQTFKHLFNGVDMAGAKLQRLDLSDNAIGPVGMEGLAPFFKSPSSFSLKELVLNNNGFGPNGGSWLARSLKECLDLSKSSGGEVFQLKLFVCGRNRLENQAAKALSKFFKEVGSLEEVHMPQNGIYKEGAQALAYAFGFNPNLKVINLNDNTLNGSGIKKISETVAKLHNLQELNLGDCLLKGSGSVSLASALRNHQKLQKINLESNEIDKLSAQNLAEMLRNVSSLQELNLSSNYIGETTLESISNMLSARVIRDDDEGSQEEEEEDENDDPNETGNSFEDVSSDSENPDLNKSKEQSFIFSAPLETPATMVPSPTLSVTVGVNYDGLVSRFISKPIAANYKALQPNVYEKIVNYVTNNAKTLGKSETELFVSTSILLTENCVEQVPEAIETFMNLMQHALDKSPSYDEFATHFLVYTGFKMSESVRIPNVTNWTLYALGKFVNERNVPVDFLRTIMLTLPKVEPQFPMTKKAVNVLAKVAARKVLQI